MAGKKVRVVVTIDQSILAGTPIGIGYALLPVVLRMRACKVDLSQPGTMYVDLALV